MLNLEPLYTSSDRKVTNKVTAAGNVSINNAFGLPAGNAYSCPGATSYCFEICYAGHLTSRWPNVNKKVQSNFTSLLYADYLGGVSAMVDLLDDMVIKFKRESIRKNAPLQFRIHWDGDFFNVDYAKAWAIVCRSHKDINFWVYTRSFAGLNVLPYIVGIPNLKIYLSADKVNVGLAKIRAHEYKLPIAMVAETFAEGRALLGDMATDFDKTYNCPEGVRLALISAKGSACMRCGVCPNVRGNVIFSKTGK